MIYALLMFADIYNEVFGLHFQVFNLENKLF